MNAGGSWIKIGRVKRSDLPPDVRRRLPKGRQYQLAAFVPSDPDLVIDPPKEGL